MQCPGSRFHSAQGLFGKEKSKKTSKNPGLKMSWLLGLGDPQSRELGAETELLYDESAKPLHTLFCRQAKAHPAGRIFTECNSDRKSVV